MMIKSRADRVLNLATAALVLLAGFYVLLFIPLRISGTAKIIFGVLLVIYFLWRVKYIIKKRPESEDVLGRKTENNKSLDKKYD
jgi:DMSO/TMAO reductase YedYZ heme-binding membrane subunit